jgi:YVTN family beta-propeller protein
MVESRFVDLMPISQLPRGTLVVDYRIEAVLGRGGMSVVYLAEDLRLKRHVALKLLMPTLAEDARFRERFLSESELAASIDHANVIPIYEAGEADGQLYIAMRYVEGSDLKARLGDGPLTDEEAVAVAAQVGGALDAAHERGLVHGDVKPSNVLIDGQGHVYLADFGLTKRLGDERSAAGDGQLMGTIDYVAPEQIRGDQVDGRADIYSLGCLLYECLTGRQPFKRGNEAAVLFAHLEDEAPATGTAADPVVLKALAKSPDDRYQTGAELAEAARAALGVAEPRPSRRLAAIAVAGVVTGVAALVAFAILRSGGGGSGAHGELFRIDPKHNRVSGSVAVGPVPSDVASAAGHVWVTSLGDGTVSLVDEHGLHAVSIPASGSPIGVAAQDGTAYVADSGSPGVVAVISTEGSRATHTLPADGIAAITSGREGLWIARDGAAERLAPVSTFGGDIVKPVPLAGSFGSYAAIAVGVRSVWVLDDPASRRLWRIDPKRGRLIASIPLPFVPAAIAVGDGSVWVTGQLDDRVARIDPATDRIVATIKVGREPLGVAVGDGAVWVADTIDRTVTRIDPATNRVTKTIDLGRSPTAIAAGDGSVWVAADGS